MVLPFSVIYWINTKQGIARQMKMRQYLESISLTDANGNKPIRFEGNTGKLVPQWVDDAGRKNRLSQSEIGCYASHYILWREIAKSDVDTALIMEDDCRFDMDKLQKVLTYWPFMPEFEFLNFCCYSFRNVPMEKKLVNHATGLVQGHGYWLTHCYAVSKAGAEKLLTLMAVQKQGLDHQLAANAQKELKTFAFASNPAFQIKLSSQINHTNP